MNWEWLRHPGARHAALAGALAVSAAYQFGPTQNIDLGSGLLAGLTGRDLEGSGADYRWTRARSAVVVPDPGPGLAVRVEAEVAGWRPRGQPAPRMALEAGGAESRAQPGPAATTVSVETTTSGLWDSDLEVILRSETFSPGAGDPRLLGVRLYRVRLVPLGPAVAPRVPALRQLAAGAAALLLFFGLLVHAGVGEARAGRAAVGLAVGVGLAYALARPQAASLSGPALLVLGGILALLELAPRLAGTLGELAAETARAAGRGVLLLARWPVVALALAGVLAVAFAYRARPSLEIDLGTGREALFERGLAAADSADGVSFRRAARGAALDLRDLGGGTDWTIDVTASTSTPAELVVARAGGAEARAALGPSWTTVRLAARADVGWSAGVVLEFPAPPRLDLRIDRVRIDRGRALPSLRALAVLLGIGLLGIVLAGAAGVRPRSAYTLGAALLAGETAALLADPVLAVPFSFVFLRIVAGGAILAALLAGAFGLAERRGFEAAPPPAAVAASALGFVLWLAVMVCPLYRGGNFIFHSAVAEEIWKGAFWKYYLPYPGSMLSRQAQWGDVIVPHPCLYHIVVAPLAALPRPWFYLVEKGVLAGFLAAMALSASLLAARAGSPRAGAYAGVVAAALVPGFLLLGLGHSMTIFGCFAMTLAFTYLVLRFDRLAERGVCWIAALLLAFCFLSYFAALLFAGFALALAVPLLWRRQPGPARSLLSAAVVALALAFGLYYAYWFWPFLTDSVPRLLGQTAVGGGGARSARLLANLARQPRKLMDSYGAPWLPLAGVAGLALASRWADRVWLLAWGGVLVAFGGVDLFFNLLLKHHYFVMVPVSVGAGLLLAWLSERGRAARLAAYAVVVYLAALGGRMALAIALGRVP